VQQVKKKSIVGDWLFEKIFQLACSIAEIMTSTAAVIVIAVS
jgi:hypothetical protein